MTRAEKRVGIIGAGGKMGSWFCKYFISKGYVVAGYDSENPLPGRAVEKASSLVGAVLQADYVMLCTPTRRTPEIIRLISKEMKRGAYLIEISSQKAKAVSALSKVPSKISPICIHPMFGPGIKKVEGKNIISIPVKDAKKELAVARSLFAGANFVTIDAAEHDKKVAVILGLTHMMNLAFANILSKDEKTNLTEKMSSPTFKMQRLITESIMTESPELIETVISNPDLRRTAEEFWKDIGRMLTAVQESKTEEITAYVKECQERLSRSISLEDSYKKLSAISGRMDKK